ncbi:MAG: arylsulfotransferase family protein [Acidobacteriota bacterium]
MRRVILPWVLASTAAVLALQCGRSRPEQRPAQQPPGLASEPSGAPDGKWRKARATPGATANETAAQLQAVPYLGGYHAPSNESGVVRFDPARAFRGLNLFTSGHAPEAILMTMEGKELRRWHASVADVFPDLARDPQIRKFDFWRRAWLYPNGDLLAIFDGHGLVKLDRSSKVLWAKAGGFHHDLEVAADGTIFVLDREGKLIPRLNPTLGVLEDFISILAPDGTRKDRISLLEAFEGSPHAILLQGMNDHGDIFHTNTLELLDGRLADEIPAFKKGNILISVLQLDTLAVIDPAQRKVVWAMRGAWKRQHQPTVLDNSHLLLFDNVGLDRDHSRVLEIDPHDGAVVWQYGSTDGHELSSRTLGTAQRLPNGDTLITESENGRAIEVTPGGETVWEYRSPYRAGEKNELVAVVFEMLRLPLNFGN